MNVKIEELPLTVSARYLVNGAPASISVARLMPLADNNESSDDRPKVSLVPWEISGEAPPSVQNPARRSSFLSENHGGDDVESLRKKYHSPRVDD